MILTKTGEEIKQIALDLFKGAIFTDRHLQDIEDIRMVFMVLSFMDGERIKELQANPPGLIYEYISEAGPRSVNGMPVFMSLKMLTQDDTKKMFEHYEQLKSAVANVQTA